MLIQRLKWLMRYLGIFLVLAFPFSGIGIKGWNTDASEPLGTDDRTSALLELLNKFGSFANSAASYLSYTPPGGAATAGTSPNSAESPPSHIHSTDRFYHSTASSNGGSQDISSDQTVPRYNGPAKPVAKSQSNKRFFRPTVTSRSICLLKRQSAENHQLDESHPVLSEISRRFRELGEPPPAITVLKSIGAVVFDTTSTTGQGLLVLENILSAHSHDILDCTPNALMTLTPRTAREESDTEARRLQLTSLLGRVGQTAGTLPIYNGVMTGFQHQPLPQQFKYHGSGQHYPPTARQNQVPEASPSKPFISPNQQYRTAPQQHQATQQPFLPTGQVPMNGFHSVKGVQPPKESLPLPPGASVLNSVLGSGFSASLYNGAKRAQELMSEYEKLKKDDKTSVSQLAQSIGIITDSITKGGSESPSGSFIAQPEQALAGTTLSKTGDDETPEGESAKLNPFDMSALRPHSIQHLDASSEQLQVLNSFIGSGFSAALQLMGASRDVASGKHAGAPSSNLTSTMYSQPAETIEELQAKREALRKQLASLGVSEETQNRMKEVPEWLLALAEGNKSDDLAKEIEKNRDDSSGQDTAMAYVAGCDCASFPQGMACPLEETMGLQVKCQGYKVWDEERQGAELADVVMAIDTATAAGSDVAVLPLWFDASDPYVPRPAPRVMRGAMQRAGSKGMLFAVPAGDDGISYQSANYANVVQDGPCDDRAGVDILCVSSLNPQTGWPSTFSNIPRTDTIYAVGEGVHSLGLRMEPTSMTGTAMSLAQGVGALNLIQGISKAAGVGSLAPADQLAMLVNPRRRVAGVAPEIALQGPSPNPRYLQGANAPVLIPGTVLDAGYAVENAMYVRGVDLPGVMSGACYLNNVNFAGKHFYASRMENYLVCQKSCEVNEKCRFFSFAAQRGLCYLFENVAGTLDSFGVIAGPQACAAPASDEAKAIMESRLMEGFSANSASQRPGAATPLRTPQAPVLKLLQQIAGATTAGGMPGDAFWGLAAGVAPGQEVMSGMQATGAGGAAQNLVNFWQATSALMETGGQFLETFPIEDLVTAGTGLYNNGFFRERGMSIANSGLGLQKQSVMPPPGAGRPEVTCMNKGMTCCVPRHTAENYKKDPPRLNDEKSSECKAHYVSTTDQLCATTLYEGEDTCNMQVIETNQYIIYQNTLMMPGRSMNNAICSCKQSKFPNEDASSVFSGSATWEYSLQGVQSDEKKRGDLDGKFLHGAATALGWAKMLGEVGSDMPSAVSGLGEVIQQVHPSHNSNAYEMIAQVPGLTADAARRRRRRRRLSEDRPDRKTRRAKLNIGGNSNVSSSWALGTKRGDGAVRVPRPPPLSTGADPTHTRTGSSTKSVKVTTPARGHRIKSQSLGVGGNPLPAFGADPRQAQQKWGLRRDAGYDVSSDNMGNIVVSNLVRQEKTEEQNGAYHGEFDGSDECLTPWPEKCMAWRSECEEHTSKRQDTKCEPVTLIEDGCPHQEMDFIIHDQQPGILSFSLRPFQFAQGAPFRIGCKYKLTKCRDASLETRCPVLIAVGPGTGAGQKKDSKPRLLQWSTRGAKRDDAVKISGSTSSELPTVPSTDTLSAIIRERTKGELKLFDVGRSKRLNKYSIVHFGGVGDILLGQWLDRDSGQLLGAAEVESVDPDYIAKVRHEVDAAENESELMETTGNRRKEPNGAFDLLGTVDEIDLVDFSWLSKIEVLPHRGSDAMLLDRYQKSSDGYFLENEMRPLQIAGTLKT